MTMCEEPYVFSSTWLNVYFESRAEYPLFKTKKWPWKTLGLNVLVLSPPLMYSKGLTSMDHFTNSNTEYKSRYIKNFELTVY